MKRSRGTGAITLAVTGVGAAVALDAAGHAELGLAGLIAAAAGFAILLTLSISDEAHTGNLAREVVPAAHTTVLLIGTAAGGAMITLTAPLSAHVTASACGIAAITIHIGATLTAPRKQVSDKKH